MKYIFAQPRNTFSHPQKILFLYKRSRAQPIVTQFRYFPLDYERLYDDDVALLGKIKLSFITVAVVTGEND